MDTNIGKITVEHINDCGDEYWEICKASDDETYGDHLFDLPFVPDMGMDELKDLIERNAKGI